MIQRGIQTDHFLQLVHVVTLHRFSYKWTTVLSDKTVIISKERMSQSLVKKTGLSMESVSHFQRKKQPQAKHLNDIRDKVLFPCWQIWIGRCQVSNIFQPVVCYRCTFFKTYFYIWWKFHLFVKVTFFLRCDLCCWAFDAIARDRCHCGRHTERTKWRKRDG